MIDASEHPVPATPRRRHLVIAANRLAAITPLAAVNGPANTAGTPVTIRPGQRSVRGNDQSGPGGNSVPVTGHDTGTSHSIVHASRRCMAQRRQNAGQPYL